MTMRAHKLMQITIGDLLRRHESFGFETGDDAPNPIPTKAMMRHLGFKVGQARLPMGNAPAFVEERAPQVWANLQSARTA